MGPPGVPHGSVGPKRGGGEMRQGCAWQGWVSRDPECQAGGLDFT